MTAKEYLLQIGFDDAHLPELLNSDDKSHYQITELMEEYHQAKLKLLGIGGVVGQSEQLKAKLDNVSELAKNFIDEVDKKHPFVSLPQDEDFYMARHRLAEKLI